VEVNVNGLCLHSSPTDNSSPADNVVAAQVALANLPVTGEGALFIHHAKALIAKALEHQYATQDSQRRLYSRSLASRAVYSAAENCAAANINNCPPPEPCAAHSTNNPIELCPPRVFA
jgi:hypothetical protein